MLTNQEKLAKWLEIKSIDDLLLTKVGAVKFHNSVSDEEITKPFVKYSFSLPTDSQNNIKNFLYTNKKFNLIVRIFNTEKFIKMYLEPVAKAVALGEVITTDGLIVARLQNKLIEEFKLPTVVLANTSQILFKEIPGVKTVDSLHDDKYFIAEYIFETNKPILTKVSVLKKSRVVHTKIRKSFFSFMKLISSWIGIKFNVTGSIDEAVNKCIVESKKYMKNS